MRIRMSVVKWCRGEAGAIHWGGSAPPANALPNAARPPMLHAPGSPVSRLGGQVKDQDRCDAPKHNAGGSRPVPQQHLFGRAAFAALVHQVEIAKKAVEDEGD